MTAHRRRPQRGMTLVEITIAAALLAISMAAAASLVLAAGRMARNSEEIGMAEARARGPGEALERPRAEAGHPFLVHPEPSPRIQAISSARAPSPSTVSRTMWISACR